MFKVEPPGFEPLEVVIFKEEVEGLEATGGLVTGSLATIPVSWPLSSELEWSLGPQLAFITIDVLEWRLSLELVLSNCLNFVLFLTLFLEGLAFSKLDLLVFLGLFCFIFPLDCGLV